MIDAEQALLGALLSGYSDFDSLHVSGADFYHPMHEWIFDAIMRAAGSGQRPDPVSVRMALGDKQHKLPTGPVYLATLTELCPLIANAPFYAGQVQEQASMRRVADLGRRLVQLSESDNNAVDIVNDARQWLDSFTDRHEGRTSAIEEALVEVIDIAEHGQRRGASSPWPDLDRLTRGYYPGRLYVVGARPGIGKSIWASNTAVHLAKQGKGVFVSSMEMSRAEWTQRCAAAEARVDIGHLEEGTLTDDEWGKLSPATSLLAGLPIDINDSETQTLAQIRAAARRSSRHIPLGMLIIDYLQLLMPGDRRLPRHEQVADMSRGLKRLARELDVPVLALAQVNRASTQRKDGRPTLADLRESGAIEADADSVILLHVDEDMPHVVEATVAKGRSTQKGTVTLQMQGHYSRLVSSSDRWTPHQAMGAAK